MEWQVSRSLGGIRYIQSHQSIFIPNSQDLYAGELRIGNQTRNTYGNAPKPWVEYDLMGTIWNIRRLGWSRNLKAYGVNVSNLSQVSSVQHWTYIDEKSPPIRSAPNVFGMLTVDIVWRELENHKVEEGRAVKSLLQCLDICGTLFKREGTQMSLSYHVSVKRATVMNFEMRI